MNSDQTLPGADGSCTVRMCRPRFSREDAIKLARELYGLAACARELPSERDQNFHLQDRSGREFVLKIASAADRRETLELQNRAMAHVAAHDPGLSCPRVLPTITGEEIATAEGVDGVRHCVRLLTHLPGRLFADVQPRTPALLRSLGRFFGLMDRALERFEHPAAHRELHWNLKDAASVVHRRLGHLENARQRELVEQCMRHFEAEVAPKFVGLRSSIIHNDGNDHNLLVAGRGPQQKVTGIIDFGDMLYTCTACDPAIAAAYAIMGQRDPVTAAAHVAAGYHEVFPLTESELEVLYGLIWARLATSVALSAGQQKLEPDNPYLSISERDAWQTLERLAAVNPASAHFTFRSACGLPPCPASGAVVRWLRENRDRFAPVVALSLKGDETLVFDLSVGSPEIDDVALFLDAKAFSGALFDRMRMSGARIGVGRYDEARLWYCSDAYRTVRDGFREFRTIHIGMDLFMEPGSPVFAPLDGTVHSFQNNPQPLDYGPTIILQHDIAETGSRFFTLYGHLSPDSLAGLSEGMPIRKAEQIARIGDSDENGGWPPHLHFQIIIDLLGRKGEFPGVAPPSEKEIWRSLCPDPNLILGIPEDRFTPGGLSTKEVLEARRRSIGRNLSLSYRRPLHIVRGYMQHLYDDEGHRYLDVVNNVPHVGHCHPRVVRAARRQAAVLNTNTRYLHENIVKLAERLCSTLPQPLGVCYFVCSGSEANDLALRLARTHTKRSSIVVVDVGYHGNLTSLIDISPYKFNGPGGSGVPAHVRVAPLPDVYRGPYRSGDPLAGEKYARHVQDAVREIQRRGGDIAAFICESAPGCGGQIILPHGYLQAAYRYVRETGGVCIADEVQVGFGRLGSHFWGFQTQGVVPDIVTMGKPFGNGHPLAAVVTTPEIAASFDNGMEYFNTFGGNPVSCAVGLAVLDVIEEENLQANALMVGEHLKAELERLMPKHAIIGDVRGMGLFIGIELVTDRYTLAPATDQAAYVIERMKDCGVLVSTDGPYHNVLKIKPPLVFTREDADLVVQTLDEVLTDDYLR